MITNLSANNSPNAIRRYRDNYDRAFNMPPASPTTRIRVIVREVPATLDDTICDILDTQDFEENYTETRND